MVYALPCRHTSFRCVPVCSMNYQLVEVLLRSTYKKIPLSVSCPGLMYSQAQNPGKRKVVCEDTQTRARCFECQVSLKVRADKAEII